MLRTIGSSVLNNLGKIKNKSVRFVHQSTSDKNPFFRKMEQDLLPYRTALMQHPLYNAINSKERLKVFTQTHIYPVYDFMWLLKRLEEVYVPSIVPFIPTDDTPIVTRFIHEILTGEQSDKVPAELTKLPQYSSHLHLYLAGMDELGADRAPFLVFLYATIEQENEYQRELQLALSKPADTKQVLPRRKPPPFHLIEPAYAREFVQFTWSLCQARVPGHMTAASFCKGREDPIAEMFQRLLTQLKSQDGLANQFPYFEYYLAKHIKDDGEDHGPMSRDMMVEVCRDDPIKWQQSTHVGKESLLQRYKLWTHTYNAVIKI